MPLSPLGRGSRIATARRPNGIPSRRARDWYPARVRRRRRVPRHPARVLGPRPTASGGVQRPRLRRRARLRLALVLPRPAASGRARRRPEHWQLQWNFATLSFPSPGRSGAVVCGICSFCSPQPNPQSMKRRDPTASSSQRRAGSQLRTFHQLKTRPRPSPTLTPALSQPPERIATLARKKTASKTRRTSHRLRSPVLRPP